ncbi:glycoside hydrolase family 30 protein [Paenibacillus sp. S-38]|uniref:glycoside hydrolase family 30 protein n=1 Tax=Paenibacillus sp. S-38 TaxID=3416710 RepID=UPI003CF6F178
MKPPVRIWTSKVNADNTGMEYGLREEPPLPWEEAGGEASVHAAKNEAVRGQQAESAASAEGSISAGAERSVPVCRIAVDPAQRFQVMDGAGASFTEASAYLLMERLTPEARREVILRLFDKEQGIGLSLLRQPIGSCDFVLGPYSYADEPQPADLPGFSIEHDRRWVLPVLQESLAVHPGRIRVTCATWSPPAWMKANGSELGLKDGIRGTLLPEHYDAYAAYISKFILAYRDEGIPVYATSIQNEPLHDSNGWPGMYFTGPEEAQFIKSSLVPAFRRYGIDAQIHCFDHNWDLGADYVQAVYDDSEVSPHVAGSAWHWYGGTESVMSEIHERYPDKGIWFTEGSGGEWNPVKHWRDGFLEEMKQVIRLPRHWCRSVIWWNVALDEHNGPDYYYVQHLNRRSTCRGLITVHQETGEVTYNADYYTLGHISKFVDTGAVRIASDTCEDDLESAAFENPDGSRVLIVSNRTDTVKRLRVTCDGQAVEYALDGEAAATLVWQAE